MGWIETIRSLLGLESSTDRRETGDVEVTVEREPDVESERAVKESSEAAVGEEAEPETPATDEVAPEATTAAESEATEESEDAEAEETAGDEGDESAPLTDLKGIGSAYAERLSAAGVESVGALADADAATLADETDISAKRLQRWIDRANER